MKVLFDATDLTEKLTSLLRLEGLAVEGDIVWGGSSGAPHAEVRIRMLSREEMAAEQPEEKDDGEDIRDVLKGLQASVERLAVQVGHLQDTRHTTPAEPKDRDQKTKGKKEPAPGPHKNRMAQIEKQIEAESELVSNPLGSSRHTNRTRAPNEYDEFPE